MAGGAADCSFWIRKLRSEAKLHELTNEGRGISVARASRLLSNALYENRGLDLSVGTMIMGYDDDGGHIYYVDNTGVRIPGDMFAVGSGSTFALGILDTERKFDMTEEEAITLGIKAIRHATFRDAFSGGFIACYLTTKDGWRKIFSEDLALSTERMLQK
jgi:20S proteasome subunit beta 5